VTAQGPRDARDDESIEQDAARANLYAIIGRLFYGAPDPALLAAIRQNSGDGLPAHGELGAAWNELRDAWGTAGLSALQQEFENLFGGVGRSEITPYTSHYVKHGVSGGHLVRLRGLLTEWQLGRRTAASETEDHVSGISDVMRHLVSGDYTLDQQSLFFNEFVYAGLIPFCDAIERSPNASFYRRVAQFVRTFLSLERAGFELQDH